MEFLKTLITAAVEHPMEALFCVAFPVGLALLFKGDGGDGGWFDGDSGCDAGGD
jgi:hypothetical protein